MRQYNISSYDVIYNVVLSYTVLYYPKLSSTVVDNVTLSYVAL